MYAENKSENLIGVFVSVEDLDIRASRTSTSQRRLFIPLIVLFAAR